MKRLIHCANCGDIIGDYPVFSHRYDDEDTGKEEYNGIYGGTVNGAGYCVSCYGWAVHEAQQDEEHEEFSIC